MVEVVKNFHVGQVIKNYKTWCELLGQKERGGKSKQLHIKELERYFRFHFDKHKIIIDEVYSEPKPKIDNRVNNGANKAKYDNLLDDIIINQVSEYGTIEASKSNLFKDYINLFTDKYIDLSLNPTVLAEEYKLGKGITKEYADKTNAIVTSCTHTSLNRLQKQGLLKWNFQTFIKENPSDEYYADDELLGIIKTYESIVYTEMDIKPIARKNLEINKRFKSKVCNYVNEKTNKSIYNYWKIYEIVSLQEDIEEREEDIEELKKRFCMSISQSIRRKEMTGDDGEKFRPYNHQKYMEQLMVLNDLIFNVKINDCELTEEDKKVIELLGLIDEPVEEYWRDKDNLPF